MAARERERRDDMQIAESALAPDPPDRLDGGVRTLRATELLGPGGVVRIELDGELYTLRLTRNHHLILTK